MKNCFNPQRKTEIYRAIFTKKHFRFWNGKCVKRPILKGCFLSICQNKCRIWMAGKIPCGKEKFTSRKMESFMDRFHTKLGHLFSPKGEFLNFGQ